MAGLKLSYYQVKNTDQSNHATPDQKGLDDLQSLHLTLIDLKSLFAAPGRDDRRHILGLVLILRNG